MRTNGYVGVHPPSWILLEGVPWGVVTMRYTLDYGARAARSPAMSLKYPIGVFRLFSSVNLVVPQVDGEPLRPPSKPCTTIMPMVRPAHVSLHAVVVAPPPQRCGLS